MDNQVSDLKPGEMVEIFTVREHRRKSRPTGMEREKGKLSYFLDILNDK